MSVFFFKYDHLEGAHSFACFLRGNLLLLALLFGGAAGWPRLYTHIKVILENILKWPKMAQNGPKNTAGVF